MPHHQHFRWRLLRDLLVFQLKLAADALRDLLLSPLSVIAALLDLSLGHLAQNSLFYRMLHFGRRSDHWINLFGATGEPAETEPSGGTTENSGHIQSLDHWVLQVEGLLKEQYERGGITASAKDAVDRTLDRWRDHHVGFAGRAPKQSTQADGSPQSAAETADHRPTDQRH